MLISLGHDSSQEGEGSLPPGSERPTFTLKFHLLVLGRKQEIRHPSIPAVLQAALTQNNPYATETFWGVASFNTLQLCYPYSHHWIYVFWLMMRKLHIDTLNTGSVHVIPTGEPPNLTRCFLPPGVNPSLKYIFYASIYGLYLGDNTPDKTSEPHIHQCIASPSFVYKIY